MDLIKLIILPIVNVVNLAINKVSDNVVRILSSFNVVDRIPENLPLLEDVLSDRKKGLYKGSSSVVVSARIGDLYSDPTYNRSDSINYGKCEANIKALKGFSHKAAGVLFAFVRPNLDVVITQGNHRVTMLWLVTQDSNARIAINLNFHSEDISEEEMIEIESENHHSDAANRAGQTKSDTFKSAFYSNLDWALKMYNLLEPFEIGVAGTLRDARFTCKSYGSIAKAQGDTNLETVKRVLEEFTGLYDGVENPDIEILGNFVRASSIFLHTFADYIAEVDKKNNVDSFSEMFKYFFRDMEPGLLKAKELGAVVAVRKNLTQDDMCISTRFFKGQHLAVCRFVSIYNELSSAKDWEYNNTRKNAIPTDGIVVASYLSSLDPVLRNAVQEYCNTPVVHKS